MRLVYFAGPRTRNAHFAAFKLCAIDSSLFILQMLISKNSGLVSFEMELIACTYYKRLMEVLLYLSSVFTLIFHFLL